MAQYPDLLTVMFWGLVTFITPTVLLIVPYLRGHIGPTVMHSMLGFSAGLLGGVTFVEILPEAFEFAAPMGLKLVVSAGVAIGLFLPFIIERHILGPERRHAHVHTEDDKEIRPMGTFTMSALMIHGVMDGFVIPIGFMAGGDVGLVVALAVALHQVPDTFAAASIGLAAGYTRKKVALFVLLTALDTPIGILLGLAFLGVGDWIIPLGLGLSAGTFVFVSAADLIPELQHRSRSAWVTLAIVFGFAFVGVLSLLVAH